MSEIVNSESLDTVVLASRWTLQVASTRFNNQEGGVERGGKAKLVALNEESEWIEDRALVLDRYKSSVDRLLTAGKKVILVYPIPEVGWNVPDLLHHRVMYGKGEDVSTSLNVFKKRNESTFAFLDSLEGEGLLRFQPSKVFCDSELKGRCIASVNNIPLYFDDDHLSSLGSMYIAEQLVKLL